MLTHEVCNSDKVVMNSHLIICNFRTSHFKIFSLLRDSVEIWQTANFNFVCQLILEWLFDVLNFPNINAKIWWIFALEFKLQFLGLDNFICLFSGGIEDMKNCIWNFPTIIKKFVWREDYVVGINSMQLYRWSWNINSKFANRL